MDLALLARQRFDDLGTLAGIYFRRVVEDPGALAYFRTTQTQFRFAVESFPRSLAFLAARIPGSASRLAVIRNLWEEHGEGSRSGFHVETFATFLARIGVEAEEIRESVPGPAVGAFNAALSGICVAEPVGLAAAALGMIEFMFSSISARIGRAAVANGWIAPGELVHYDLHAELDIEHAAELFETARIEASGEEDLRRGIDLGGHVFDALYRDLAREALAAAARRSVPSALPALARLSG